MPVRVGDRLERLRLENPEIVHQDVGLAGVPQEVRHAGGAGEIGGDPVDAATRDLFLQSRCCAAFTLSRLRPLMRTAAPAPASPRTIAKPIPEVEPVTIARLPLRSMIMLASR